LGCVIGFDHRLLRSSGNMDAQLTRAAAVGDPEQFTPPVIVPLHPVRDRPALDRHFAALRREDLRYRFGGSTKPAAVSRYLDQWSAASIPSYGIFNTERELVAWCQLGRSGYDLEVGLTVVPAYRRQGFGRALLDRAVSYGRAQGLSRLVVHSLADNAPMLSLARRIGMTVEILLGEADGRLILHAAAAINFCRC
jgi:GNAT superfamily N-acetyltransferase